MVCCYPAPEHNLASSARARKSNALQLALAGKTQEARTGNELIHHVSNLFCEVVNHSLIIINTLEHIDGGSLDPATIHKWEN